MPGLRQRIRLPSGCSFSWIRAVDLRRRARLGRAGQTRLGRDVAAHDDRAGQAAALVVAGGGAVPVVAGTVELELGRAPRVVHEPEELRVAVARKNGAVGVLVVVVERDLDRAAVRQDQNSRVVDELVLRDPDLGGHRAVGPLLGVPDVPAAQDPAQRDPVLLVQLRYVDSSFGHESSPRVCCSPGHPQGLLAALSTRPPIVFRARGRCRDSARGAVRSKWSTVRCGSGTADALRPPRQRAATAPRRPASSVPPTACSSARALSSISSSSASGSEPATIAPPAPIASPPGAATSVRMTTLRSAVPLTPRKSSAPE